MTWLEDVLTQTAEAETPQSFIYWSALAAIAATVGKKVWLDKHLYKLYPNVYVLLVAKSGMRKGFAVSIAKDLVTAVSKASKMHVRIISGRNSIQGIIKELATARTLETGEVITKAQGFLVSGEFSTFLIEDPQGTTILTDLYDTHYYEEYWRNTLKGTGIEELKEPCLTMLGASNQRMFKESIPDYAYSGGFIARCLLIVEEKRHVKNSLTEPPEVELNIASLTPHLVKIAQLKGPILWTEPAKKLFDDWYMAFDSEGKDDPTGTVERIHDQILKVAMLISLAQRADMRLEQDDVQNAMDSVLTFTTNATKLHAGKGGKSAYGEQSAIVLDELCSSPTFSRSRSNLLKKYYGDFDALDLDRIIETLVQGGLITIGKGRRGDFTYMLTEEVIDQVKKYNEAKKVKH